MPRARKHAEVWNDLNRYAEVLGQIEDYKRNGDGTLNRMDPTKRKQIEDYLAEETPWVQQVLPMIQKPYWSGFPSPPQGMEAVVPGLWQPGKAAPPATMGQRVTGAVTQGLAGAAGGLLKGGPRQAATFGLPSAAMGFAIPPRNAAETVTGAAGAFAGPATGAVLGQRFKNMPRYKEALSRLGAEAGVGAGIGYLGDVGPRIQEGLESGAGITPGTFAPGKGTAIGAALGIAGEAALSTPAVLGRGATIQKVKGLAGLTDDRLKGAEVISQEGARTRLEQAQNLLNTEVKQSKTALDSAKADYEKQARDLSLAMQEAQKETAAGEAQHQARIEMLTKQAEAAKTELAKRQQAYAKFQIGRSVVGETGDVATEKTRVAAAQQQKEFQLVASAQDQEIIDIDTHLRDLSAAEKRVRAARTQIKQAPEGMEGEVAEDVINLPKDDVLMSDINWRPQNKAEYDAAMLRLAELGQVANQQRRIRLLDRGAEDMEMLAQKESQAPGRMGAAEIELETAQGAKVRVEKIESQKGRRRGGEEELAGARAEASTYGAARKAFEAAKKVEHTTTLGGMQDTIDTLQRNYESVIGSNPRLAPFFKSPSMTPVEFAQTIFDKKFEAEGLADIVAAIQSRGGQKAVDSFRAGLVKEFFLQEGLTKGSVAGFTADKWEKLFIGSPNAKAAAGVINDLMSFYRDRWLPRTMSHLGDIMIYRLPQVMILGTMYASTRSLALSGGALGIAIGWPAMINWIVSNPRNGAQMLQWLKTNPSARSLSAYPAVAQFFRDRGRPIRERELVALRQGAEITSSESEPETQTGPAVPGQPGPQGVPPGASGPMGSPGAGMGQPAGPPSPLPAQSL